MKQHASARFKGFDRLNSFIGFCPDKNSSGETDRDRTAFPFHQ
jgi:hypothetical protein